MRRARTQARILVDHLKDWDYLRKWLVLGSVIGVVAGLAAIAFILALELAGTLLLEQLGGYHPPLPIGEGNRLVEGHFTRPWAIPLVVGLGGLASGALVFRFAPEAEGHGTDAAIAAIHHNPRGIRPRVTVVKLVSSALTIGSGGSAGREGPTAQIAAGFGSLLARRLMLSPRDARIAVAVGMGAGIGAIFRAPLGGAVLGTEILYREDLEPDALLPSLVGSIVAFSVFGTFGGFTPIFGELPTPPFDHPVELFSYALLGLAAGLVGRVYIRGFYGCTALSRRVPGPEMLKPAAAGVLVGLLGLAFPQALATGYGWLQLGMEDGLPSTALWVILVLPFVKILATSLSIGSGGSGGIFGPGMVIGGFTGLGLWRLLSGPGIALPTEPAPFIVVGMIACFGSIAHAPLGLMLMVAEMTGSLALLPPAMIAIGVAAVAVGDRTIYQSQLRSRAEAPAQRAASALPLAATVKVGDVMTVPRLLLPCDLDAESGRTRLDEVGVRGAPVVDAKGALCGVVSRDVLGGDGATGDGTARLDALADRSHPSIPADASLDMALDTLVSGGVTWIPVVHEGRVSGIVALNEVIGGYQAALRRSLRLFTGVRGHSTLVEAVVGEDGEFAHQTVAEAPWPKGTVALSIERNNQLLTPRSQTLLLPGDFVVAVAPDDEAAELQRRLSGGGHPVET